jgi:hypothetical protein
VIEKPLNKDKTSSIIDKITQEIKKQNYFCKISYSFDLQEKPVNFSAIMETEVIKNIEEICIFQNYQDKNSINVDNTYLNLQRALEKTFNDKEERSIFFNSLNDSFFFRHKQVKIF